MDTTLSPHCTASVVERQDGTRLHMIEAGEGQPVLLVHGFSASVDEWDVVMPALVERGFRVIAYDHRAHGRSTVGSDGCSSHALFADLVAVAEHLEFTDGIIVGHSMGTYTSLGALAYGSLRARVRAAVLVSTETGDLYRGAPVAKTLVPLLRTGILSRVARHEAIGRRAIASTAGPGATAEVLDKTRELLAAAPRSCMPFLGVMAKDTVTAALPAIDAPLRLLLGDADGVTPCWHSDLVVERAPDATLTMLPGVGHMVNWERPQAIVDAVQSAALRAL